MITNVARRTSDITYGIAMARTTLKNKKCTFHQQGGLQFKEKLPGADKSLARPGRKQARLTKL